MMKKPLDKGAVKNFLDNTVTETKIKSMFLDATRVNVTDFLYHSINGHDFLFDWVLSGKEKRKATAVVREIENVKNLARPGPRISAQPAARRSMRSR